MEVVNIEADKSAAGVVCVEPNESSNVEERKISAKPDENLVNVTSRTDSPSQHCEVAVKSDNFAESVSLQSSQNVCQQGSSDTNECHSPTPARSAEYDVSEKPYMQPADAEYVKCELDSMTPSIEEGCNSVSTIRPTSITAESGSNSATDSCANEVTVLDKQPEKPVNLFDNAIVAVEKLAESPSEDMPCTESKSGLNRSRSSCQSSSHSKSSRGDSEDDSDCLLSELDSELEITYGEDDVSCQKRLLNGFTEPGANTEGDAKRPGGNSSSEERVTLDCYEIQMELLERTNVQLQKDINALKERLSRNDVQSKKVLADTRAELLATITKLTKANELAQKEKETMVVRFAQSEKEVLVLKKTREDLEKKLRDAAKDREALHNKIKGLNMERSKLCGKLDSKVSELSIAEREQEHLKEELSAKEIKIKWVQNKLKAEIDAHKDTQAKLEYTQQRFLEKREEAEQVRKDCQEMIRRYQDDEDIRSVSLDHQLRDKLNELEVEKQERSDREEVFQMLKQELEALKKKHKLSINENNTLTVKIQTLEKDRLEHEQIVSRLKETQNSLRQEIVDLCSKLTEMENLQLQLNREKEKVAATQKEIERIKMTNSELQADMDACHKKEGELLEFTERMTAKSVHLQSEYSLLEVKAQTLEEEVIILNKRCEELENHSVKLKSQLEEEQQKRHQETQLLARKLAEKTKTAEQLNVQLQDADNESRVLKRRHITSIRELTRELQHAKKRLEMLESYQAGGECPANMGSRASSSGSLDAVANNPSSSSHSNSLPALPPPPPVVTFSGSRAAAGAQTKELPLHSSTPPPLAEIDKQLLIERISKLQRTLARKNDKIEFLEEHISQLLVEIKKKAKIIQSYCLREETGVLSSNSMDLNKLEFAQRGGIMASVYSSHPADSHMTLELSLEINHKLQAVLEDTLLKNITLKENINTLGEEIARLTKSHRDLQKVGQFSKILK